MIIPAKFMYKYSQKEIQIIQFLNYQTKTSKDAHVLQLLYQTSD